MLASLSVAAAGGVVLLAAESAPLDLTQLGVAATTVAILLYIARQLWAEVKALRQENRELMTLALEKVTTISALATTQIEANGKVLTEATEVMRSFADRSLPPEDWYEIRRLLRREQR